MDLSQQLRGCLRIVSCEALGEAIVGRREQLAGPFAFALSRAKARQIQGRAQFPR
jgi:hypothetical protein